ncbi:MAG TPA: MSMEG_0569 family flavin-dependent oxidoreductase, partial [Polyangiaceae bacterium]|nr:MSMEG_0569 family flavin-dependent oxidoreductase [Polyangiaceae bacterium]
HGTADALPSDARSGKVRVLSFRKHAPRDARAGQRSPKPTLKPHYPVIVIGGGQAGLSVSYHLMELGIEHVVLEKKQIAHSWRNERWDTFCLVTPNWQCRLPGFPYHGSDPYGFMLKDEIVKYIEEYVAFFSPPVVEGVSVERLRRGASTGAGGAGFELETSRGRVTADQVVLATGGYPIPIVPPAAARLPSSIAQVHSSDYRNPEQLPPGEVLVVGSGQSGCQIAEDLHLKGRKVHLCIGNAPRCARTYRGKDVVEWLQEMGYYDMTIDKHPNPESVREKTNHYVTGRDGGRDIDLRQFAAQGMRLYGLLADIDGTRLTFAPGLRANLDGADAVYNGINRSIDAHIEKQGIAAPPATVYTPGWEPATETLSADAAALGITSVVWCIGFRTDYAWVEFPVFDAKGHPVHRRGVTDVPGLYFIGLPWLNTWGSGRFSGVGKDAHHVVNQINEALGQREPATAVEYAALGS